MYDTVSCDDKHPNERMLFNKQIWRISDVAEFLGISEGHIYNLVSKSHKTRKKTIPYRKKGKLLFFKPSEILEWIDEGDLLCN